MQSYGKFVITSFPVEKVAVRRAPKNKICGNNLAFPNIITTFAANILYNV
jgi:hypothetical protein